MTFCKDHVPLMFVDRHKGLLLTDEDDGTRRVTRLQAAKKIRKIHGGRQMKKTRPCVMWQGSEGVYTGCRGETMEATVIK